MRRPRFGIDWRCFLLLYGTKLAFSMALSGPVTTHLLSSPLVQSVRGDRPLLLDGGRTLASLLIYAEASLGHLGPYAIALFSSAWVADKLVQAFTFRAMRHKSTTALHPSANLTQVALRFGCLSLAYVTCIGIVLYAFWNALGYVGTLGLSLLGERVTDCFELALAAMVALLGLALRVTADQMRCRVALHDRSIGQVFQEAPRLFGRISAPQLARAIATLGIGYALPFIGLGLAPRLAATLVTHGPTISLALTELGSAAGIGLYLMWVNSVTNSTPTGARVPFRGNA